MMWIYESYQHDQWLSNEFSSTLTVVFTHEPSEQHEDIVLRWQQEEKSNQLPTNLADWLM